MPPRTTSRAATSSLLFLACTSTPPRVNVQTVEIPAPAPSAIASPATLGNGETFFADDPLLDGFEPKEPWVFRQETWSGAGEAQQHCHEIGYPATIRERIVTETNTLLAAHGIPGNVPNTVRADHLVFALSDFNSRLLPPSEPLIKLIYCTEGVASREGRDRLVAELRGYGPVKELPFGEPTQAWKRKYRDGREELGLRWVSLTPEAAGIALERLGYTHTYDEPRRTHEWRRAGIEGHMPGTELWWSAVR